MGTPSAKILTLNQLSRRLQKLKASGQKIVHCHGVFDLIHPGHIYHFRSAKKHGDLLVVTITADRFVKKGPGRPVFNEDLRCEVLAALSDVDYVAISSSDSAIEAIDAIKPDVYIKGPDYKYRQPNPAIPRKLGIEEKTVGKWGGKLVYTDDKIIFSSSHLLNQYFESYPPTTKNYLDHLRRKYTGEEIINKLLTLKQKKILVIGDTIIDEYHYTLALNKSSKEPVLVHLYKSEEAFTGGILACANHLSALSNYIRLITLLGTKPSHAAFIRKHLKPQVRPSFFYDEGSRTIVDRRFLDQVTHQKLFQVRYMDDITVSKKVESRIISYLKKELKSTDLVIVNDFGHGLFTPKIIRLLSKEAKFLAINVQANSANYGFNVITKYPRAHFACVDLMEIRLATHDRFSDIHKLIKKIAHKLHCQELVVTMGAGGAKSYIKANGFLDSPALSQTVVDRVGAGDAFFSIAAAASYLGMNQELVSYLGNVAGALKVQTVGNRTPIDFKEITKFISRLLK